MADDDIEDGEFLDQQDEDVGGDLDEEIDEEIDEETLDEDSDDDAFESDDEFDEDDDEDEDESGEEADEALEELEAEELELTDDEADELHVDEAATLRAIRREELTLDVEAQGAGTGEFVCQSCFLVKRRTQLANKKKMYCLDCAS